MSINRFDGRSRSLLTTLCVIALVMGVLPAAPAAAEVSHISANLSFGDIALRGFDYPVEVSVDNSEPVTVNGDTEVLGSDLGFALEAGMVIKATKTTDGVAVVVKEMVIQDLTFDTFDIDAQEVAGGLPGGVGSVQVMLGDQCGGWAEVTGGGWSFDVSVCSGFELVQYMPADVRIYDEDGDETLASFLWPRFSVIFEGPPYMDDMIQGGGWPYGTELRILIEDGSATIFDTTTLVDGLNTQRNEWGLYDFFHEANSFQFYEFPPGFGFQPGWTVTVGPVVEASPWLTKTHTITSVLPTGVDLEADTVFGTAEPGSQVVVSGCAVSEIYVGDQPWGGAWSRLVDVNEFGYWEADFSTPGFARFGLDDFRYVTEVCELSGPDFGATQIDDEFDETQRAFLIPQISVGLNQGEWIEVHRVNADPKLIEIFDHPGGVLLWSGVIAPITDEEGERRVEIGYDTHGIDLQPGMLVRVPGGELVLAELTLEFDTESDIVFGTAPGSAMVRIDVGADDGWCSGEVPVVDDRWEVNLGTPEEGGFDCTLDLTKQSYAWISVEDPTDVLWDFEGDRTHLGWETPPQWATEQIAWLVDFLLVGADDKTAKSLDKALGSIEQSQDAALWRDYRTLDADAGALVFELGAKAAGELEKIESLSFTDEHGNLNEFTGTDLAGWLVLAVDRPLVEYAIGQATGDGGDPEDLAKASASLDRANDALEQGDPSKAIVYLGDAWKNAQKALK